jgi:hypothetical protein
MHARLSVGMLVAVSVALFPFVTSAAAGQDDGRQSPALIEIVRDATRQYLDPNAAVAAGYVPKPFCVSGPDHGAMGVHFVNPALVKGGVLDPRQPQTLVYESRNGEMRLVAAEYVVFADTWNATNTTPPTLAGQLLNYIGAPNRFGFPNFYELHVWAWRDNPFGTFADWNPQVSCVDHMPQL